MLHLGGEGRGAGGGGGEGGEDGVWEEYEGGVVGFSGYVELGDDGQGVGEGECGVTSLISAGKVYSEGTYHNLSDSYSGIVWCEIFFFLQL